MRKPIIHVIDGLPAGFMVVCASLVIASAVVAQPSSWQCLTVKLGLDSGFISNSFAPDEMAKHPSPEVVFSQLVGSAAAPWIRLHFGPVLLSGSRVARTMSVVRITSVEDGAVQILDAATMREWRNASAFFNGGIVKCELLAYANTGQNRVIIDEVVVGINGGGAVASLCGEDDRVLSADPRVGRALKLVNDNQVANCSAFLINTSEHCFLTAGHCTADGNGNIDDLELAIVEFNVPLSDPNGNPNFAHPDDQYAVDPDSIQFNFDGEGSAPGNDWCYFGAFGNPMTGLTPLAAQGSTFILAEVAPRPDSTAIQITGYGADNTPLEYNQVQQTEVGAYDTLSGTTISYDDIDTQPASSGSPIEHLGLGLAIGIHTNAGCDLPLGANHGTAIHNPGLQNALDNPLGICAGPFFGEAISRAFTIGPPPPGEPFEAISRAFTILVVKPLPCPWDCANGDGEIGIEEFLAVLGQWGTEDTCDFDGGGVGITDFLKVLGLWGPCP